MQRTFLAIFAAAIMRCLYLEYLRTFNVHCAICYARHFSQVEETLPIN